MAVVRRYRKNFASALEAVAADTNKTAADALELYFEPYVELGETDHKVCLCGALSGEALVLQDEMRREVKRFFEDHQAWLETIIRKGVMNGEFSGEGLDPKKYARLCFSALQGALLVERTTGDKAQLYDVIDEIRASL